MLRQFVGGPWDGQALPEDVQVGQAVRAVWAGRVYYYEPELDDPSQYVLTLADLDAVAVEGWLDSELSAALA